MAGAAKAIADWFGAATIEGKVRDTERDQAAIRLILSSTAAFYVLIGTAIGLVPERSFLPLVACIGSFIIIASLLLYAIVLWPGVYPARRAFAMLLDYGAITFSMTMGGEYALPLYALLLWVTVGNGMRFGPRYLAVATGLALLSLGLTTHFSRYWSGQPYMVATLTLTAILVPAYAHLLLTQTRRAHDAAIAANLAKSQFLAQASHDLRQPIHAISLFTACLRDAGLGPDQSQLVDNIDKSLYSVSRLFRSLLDISTLDSGKVMPKVEVIALNEILESIVQQNFKAAEWRGVELRCVRTKQYVHTDANLLTTVLQNIVSNALKYAPGGPVLIGCRRHGSTLSIEVRDQGRGISEEHLSKVFDEFYRVAEPGWDVEGVGLGLSIVKRMANLMGLTVRVASCVGKGTAVRIEGFRVEISDDTRTAPRPMRPFMALHGMRVLLLEDSQEVLQATCALLEKWGCKVQAETSMPANVETCDFVVCDFDLGDGLTGGQCITQVREQLGQHVPAIVMTGHDESRVGQLLGDDSITILAKPVRPAELRAVLMSQRFKDVQPGT